MAIIVYIRGIDSFQTLKGSQILSSSGVNNMGCYCPGRCGGNIPHRSAHKGCHILVYRYFWSSATHITDDTRPKIVDALLTLIFKQVLWPCHDRICTERLPICSLSTSAVAEPLEYTWCNTQKHSHSVDTQLTLCWCSVDALLMLCGRSVDAHFEV